MEIYIGHIIGIDVITILIIIGFAIWFGKTTEDIDYNAYKIIIIALSALIVSVLGFIQPNLPNSWFRAVMFLPIIFGIILPIICVLLFLFYNNMSEEEKLKHPLTFYYIFGGVFVILSVLNIIAGINRPRFDNKGRYIKKKVEKKKKIESK